jgi:mannosyl-3-phosphoglycerate phosphatase
MLAPRHVIFTAVEGALLDPSSKSWLGAADALAELERRRVPLVISTQRTRAQLEPLRRKLEHSHPFISESGGGLFIPDGYFAVHLDRAERRGRYFCVPFGRPHDDAIDALQQISSQTGIEVVGISQMTARELARNTGQSPHEAELARQREFGERFFFAGATEEGINRFVAACASQKWTVVRGEPLCELRAGHSEGQAVRYLMRLYRKSRMRIGSVGIGSDAVDLSLLTAVDRAIVLPKRNGYLDPEVVARLQKFSRGERPGPEGWERAVLSLLGRN